MDRNTYGNKSQFTKQNILFWTVGILLTLSMLSTWLVCGIFAKYVITYPYSDHAHVAASGGSIELKEHEANLNNGIYKLDETKEVTGNTYEKVIPGVDIAKDPFIEVTIKDSEVTYELYIQVVKSDYFPDTVTYKLTDKWELVDAAKGIYKYKDVLNNPFSGTIKVLENDKLYVSEYYVGKDKNGKNLEFSLSFNAWLESANSN